jgi:XTP/dITP diphosphohydrolase
MTVWFATGNAHKKTELSAILKIRVTIPGEAGISFSPDETGASFYENALLKARELYRLLQNCPLYHPGDPVIADDSGLCVDALGGRPGIFSARYAGPDTAPNAARGEKFSAPERNALLLAELGDNPLRSARFVCAMVLLTGEDRFSIVQETLEGEIVKGAEYGRGTGGFGYDPIFCIPELGRTVAELSAEEKNRLSHRGKAGQVIANLLCQN